MRRPWLVCLSCLLGVPASAQIRAGGEFQVNTYTTDDQYQATVAMDANGDFVVAWTTDGQDGSLYGVRWRRFKSTGVSPGSGAANVYTTNFQQVPAVATGSRGNFIVTWSSSSQDGDGRGIYARRFDRTGLPASAEFKVNGHTQDNQFAPSVAVAPSGNFVVTWMSQFQDGDGYGIFARLFDAAGNPIQGAQVNTYTTGQQQDPVVAVDAVGNFVVVWWGPGLGDDGIFAQRYDAAGNAVGGNFQVNTYTTGPQYLPSVSMDPSGKFVVVWQSAQEGGSLGIVGRRFDAAGAPLGSEFLVNTYTTSNQFVPQVATDEHGNFVVVWESYGQDGDSGAIVGRQFDSSGVPQTAEFLINTYTTGTQALPSVASSPDGDFVVVWASRNQDGSGDGVFGQRFGDLIFEDNFESGDLSRWTTTQTDGADLSVAPAGALAGTGRGLQVVVNDTNSIYIQDDTPSAENRYRARFYVDPSGIDPGEAQGHQRIRIFMAHDALSQRVVTIVLKRLSGQYSVEARARLNDGSRVETGFFAISDAPHFLEFDWQRATGPGAGNGTLALLVDDVPVSTLSGLDTDLMTVEDGRMGVMSVKTGAAGTIFFDQFESRKLRAIGPE